MSRNTKMKQIAAEGLDDHYHSEDDEQFDSEDEEIIEDIIIHYQNQFTKKEIIRTLDKYNWVEDDVYDALDDLKKKREQKQNKGAEEKKQPTGGNMLVKKQQSQNQQGKSNNEQAVQLTKQASSTATAASTSGATTSAPTDKSKAGEYIKIERDVVKFNQAYPSIEYDIEADKKEESVKNMNLVIVGHVDAGKSTLVGHLCHLKKVIDQKLAHKNEKESKNLGKESFKFAWVNDEFEAERQRGITIDIGYKVIQTKNKNITFLDAPGHKDFVPNMIQGVTQADYALLVIEGSLQAFERGFEFGGQTKEHAFLVKQLGVQRLIILINKMDSVNWDRNRFEYIKLELTRFLISIGYSEDNLIFVPISAFYAENIVEKSKLPEVSWYEGKCLMDLLDTLPVPIRPVNTPLRLNIYNSFYQKNKGLIIQGKVEGGVIYEKSKALIMPQGLIVQVKEINRENVKIKYAKVGENIDVHIVHKEDCEIRSGDVLCSIEHPIPISRVFEVDLSAFELNYPILKGAQVVMYINTAKCPGYIKKITAILDKANGQIIKKNPKCIRNNECAIVEVCIEKENCMELFSNFKSFGRVVLREKMNTIGVGSITKIM
ncbi:hypothetical protein ABPG72_017900 [Tetrahymena utriculariae]